MRYAGYAIMTGPEGIIERDLLRCCHCQRQWYVKPGSGNRRGWCGLCNAPHCGAPTCQSCVPFMKKIEAQEQRQRLLEAIGV